MIISNMETARRLQPPSTVSIEKSCSVSLKLTNTLNSVSIYNNDEIFALTSGEISD